MTFQLLIASMILNFFLLSHGESIAPKTSETERDDMTF